MLLLIQTVTYFQRLRQRRSANVGIRWFSSHSSPSLAFLFVDIIVDPSVRSYRQLDVIEKVDLLGVQCSKLVVHMPSRTITCSQGREVECGREEYLDRATNKTRATSRSSYVCCICLSFVRKYCSRLRWMCFDLREYQLPLHRSILQDFQEVSHGHSRSIIFRT